MFSLSSSSPFSNVVRQSSEYSSSTNFLAMIIISWLRSTGSSKLVPASPPHFAPPREPRMALLSLKSSQVLLKPLPVFPFFVVLGIEFDDDELDICLMTCIDDTKLISVQRHACHPRLEYRNGTRLAQERVVFV